MTYYVIWVVTQASKFLGLKTEGRLGEEPGQKRVWELYTQLPIFEAKLNFKRLNDAFIYTIIIKVTRDIGYRLTPEVMQMIKEWDCWFLHNQ